MNPAMMVALGCLVVATGSLGWGNFAPLVEWPTFILTEPWTQQ